MNKITILGSTGSIGRTAIDIITKFLPYFDVDLLTGHNNPELLAKQAIQVRARRVLITNEKHLDKVQHLLKDTDIRVYASISKLCEFMTHAKDSLILSAISGIAGLAPTLCALQADCKVAIANKESIILGEHMIQDYRHNIIPVDSEHSSIFRMISKYKNFRHIEITASGGALREYSADYIRNNTISLEDVIQHPNWDMGKKITIDSASMANKLLEIFEAQLLFDLESNQISAILHPNSIIHGIIQLKDGSFIMHAHPPSMEYPIAFAILPDKIIENHYDIPSVAVVQDNESSNLFFNSNLTFHKIDEEKYPIYSLLKDMDQFGVNAKITFCIANEVAVHMFIENQITYQEIYPTILNCLRYFSSFKPDSMNKLDSLEKIHNHYQEIYGYSVSLYKYNIH